MSLVFHPVVHRWMKFYVIDIKPGIILIHLSTRVMMMNFYIYCRYIFKQEKQTVSEAAP